MFGGFGFLLCGLLLYGSGLDRGNRSFLDGSLVDDVFVFFHCGIDDKLYSTASRKATIKEVKLLVINPNR